MVDYDCKNAIQRWTKTAIECYKRGCNCKGCYIPRLYFQQYQQACHAKIAVLATVRKFGIPKELERKDKENFILEEE